MKYKQIALILISLSVSTLSFGTSNTEITQQIIKESISSYSGNCACVLIIK